MVGTDLSNVKEAGLTGLVRSWLKVGSRKQ